LFSKMCAVYLHWHDQAMRRIILVRKRLFMERRLMAKGSVFSFPNPVNVSQGKQLGTNSLLVTIRSHVCRHLPSVQVPSTNEERQPAKWDDQKYAR
jgi:hypothetical protein